MNHSDIKILSEDAINLNDKEWFQIENLIKKLGIDIKKNIICSCGSGVTACILKFALELLNENKNIKIYDGSWSEWGTKEDSPCEKN